MRTRSVLGTIFAAWGLALLSAGGASAERTLVGITVGRSYRTVLAKYGTPDRIDAVVIPTGTAPNLGGQYGGVGGFGGQPGFGQPGFGGAPGLPGDSGGGSGGFPGAPGGFPGAGGAGGFPGAGGAGGFPGAGGPGFSGGGPAASGPGGFGGAPGGFPGGGGPPVLPGAGGAGGFPGAPGGGAGGFPGAPGGGGFPGAPGGSDPSGGGFGGFGGGQAGGVTVGNAALWTYRRPKGVTYEFLINEDGLVAQITVSGQVDASRMGLGARLGSSYSDVLRLYGYPETHLMTTVGGAGLQQGSMSYSGIIRSGGQVTQVTYPDKHHVAFTLLNQRVVRMTVALAE